MMTLAQFCTQNGIDALTCQEFTNWLLDNDYDLNERDVNQWWHLWYKFLVGGVNDD